MALDTKKKQGSAINVGMPWRSWLAEPGPTLAYGDRLSLLKLVYDSQQVLGALLCGSITVEPLLIGHAFMQPLLNGHASLNTDC